MLRGKRVRLDHRGGGVLLERVREALVLVEQLHHLVHGIEGGQQPLGARLRGAPARVGKDLLGRHRAHHLVEHDVGGVGDAVLLVVGVVHAGVAALGVVLFVELREPAHVGLQLLQVGRRARKALGGVGHLVEVERGHGGRAAHAHAPVLGVRRAGVLDVELAALLEVERGELRDGDLVAAGLERGQHLRGAAFGMLLRQHEAQRGAASRSLAGGAGVDDDLVAGRRCRTERLPGVEAADSQVARAVALRGDAVVHVHRALEALGGQQLARGIELGLERRAVRVELAARRIWRV